MEFEWDERKRLEVISRRKVDILYAAQIFVGPVLTRVDDRRDYGEVRHIALGLVDKECFAVVYTQRGHVVRLITAWKGGRDERAYYETGLAGGYRGDEGEG